jgi:hypothetical protein
MTWWIMHAHHKGIDAHLIGLHSLNYVARYQDP